jgi:hypothetical protein
MCIFGLLRFNLALYNTFFIANEKMQFFLLFSQLQASQQPKQLMVECSLEFKAK